MSSIIRNSIYFLGATIFAIYFGKFIGHAAQILAFWPVLLANATDHFILTKDILTYIVANLIWLIAFPSFIAAVIEYKNQTAAEIDWRYTPAPKTKIAETVPAPARPKTVKTKQTRSKNKKSKKK